jgi:hypothetical protein
LIRLKRTQTRGAQIAISLVAAIVLGALSFVFLRFAEETLIRVIGGAFGLIALLLFAGSIHRVLAMRTPETLLELDEEALTRGRTHTAIIRQPGDASFESLRVNLVGEEQTRGRKRHWNRRMIENINLLDSGPFDGAFERTFTFQVPSRVEATCSELRRRIRWQFEVWGKVRGRADFQHAYDIQVQKP